MGHWLKGKLGLLLMGGAMLSKSLIQFSVAGRGCVPSLLFDLRPNFGGGNEDNDNLLQKVPCMHCCTQCPQPCSRPPLIHTSAGDSWTLTGKSGWVSCGVTAPFSQVLVQRFCLCPPRVCFPSPGAKVLFVPSKSLFPQSCVSYGSSVVRLMATSISPQEGLCHTQVYCTQSPCLCSNPLLTCTSPGSTQTQFWLIPCVISGSWWTQGLFEQKWSVMHYSDAISKMIQWSLFISKANHSISQ